MIAVKPLREEGLRAGFAALGERLPKDMSYPQFRSALKDWDVKAFCRGNEPVGMLMVKGPELHVAVVPEVRGKWLSRRLIRDVLAPLLHAHKEIRTSVQPENGIGRDFVSRLGFSGNDLSVLRLGFENMIFDPVTALVAGGATIVGGLIAADASNSAADTQAAAANRSADTQKQMFDVVNAQGAPWRQAGANALGSLADMQPQFTHSFTADDLKTNLAPNYDFQLKQGLGAVRAAGNMQTGLISGNTLRGINDYAQNFAGNAYQQAFNNYNAQQTNIFNRLSNIAGLGQTANQTTATSGTTAAGNIGNAQMAAGASQAAGQVGVANALSGGINNAASWYAMNRFMNPQTGGTNISGLANTAYTNPEAFDT